MTGPKNPNFRTPGDSGQQENSGLDMDKLRDYSREFEHDYNEADIFPDKEDPADYWKKSLV